MHLTTCTTCGSTTEPGTAWPLGRCAPCGESFGRYMARIGEECLRLRRKMKRVEKDNAWLKRMLGRLKAMKRPR